MRMGQEINAEGEWGETLEMERSRSCGRNPRRHRPVELSVTPPAHLLRIIDPRPGFPLSFNQHAGKTLLRGELGLKADGGCGLRGPCSFPCRRWEAYSKLRRKLEKEAVNAAEN